MFQSPSCMQIWRKSLSGELREDREADAALPAGTENIPIDVTAPHGCLAQEQRGGKLSTSRSLSGKLSSCWNISEKRFEQQTHSHAVLLGSQHKFYHPKSTESRNRSDTKDGTGISIVLQNKKSWTILTSEALDLPHLQCWDAHVCSVAREMAKLFVG